MSAYDPNAQPGWTPPPAPGYIPVPADAQPTTGGDRWALVALSVSLMVVLMCVPGLNCLAIFIPLVTGIVALVKAKSAVDPSRARLYGWIATAIGILILLGVVGLIAVYSGIIASVINSPEFQRLQQR